MSVFSEINKHPSKRDLLELGLMALGGGGAVGAVYRFALAKPAVAEVVWIVSAAIFVVSFVPPIGRLVYIAWMGLGAALGVVTSPIIMLLVYLLLFVPLGIIFKLTGRDAMRRRREQKASSYWESYPHRNDPARYLRQY